MEAKEELRDFGVGLLTVTAFVGGIYGFFNGLGHWGQWIGQRKPKGKSTTLLGPICDTVYDFSNFTWIVGGSLASSIFVGATFPVSVPLIVLIGRSTDSEPDQKPDQKPESKPDQKPESEPESK